MVCDYRDQQAQSQLSAAIEKYSAPIRPAGEPPNPEMMSFASAQERAKVTNPPNLPALPISTHLPRSGRVARYFAGITFRELGDNANAEKDLKDAADSRSKEIGSLAKLALAGLYHDTNRDPQAIAIYKELADHPTASVGKGTAQLLLASLYEESHQPDQARTIYQQMQKESPGGPIAQLATQKLQAMKQ